jgi:peptidyl-tRNA hydrolase, PTH1 family
MKLIFGIGNPGREYSLTRHNMGFIAIDYVTKELGLNNFKEKFNGLYCEYLHNGEKIIFLKPQCYVNLSGTVLKKYIDFFKIDLNDILIITDDLDMETGKIKLKQSSGTGGHNGLKSIEEVLGTNRYKRLKIGISSNKKINTKDYVLGKFDEGEMKIINDTLVKIKEIIIDFLDKNFLDLMNKYNIKG